MSIVLKDGTVLPDIPSEVKDQYSDIVIVYARTMIGYPSETENYMLVAANADFVHYNEAAGEEAGDYIRFPSECVSYACAVDDLSEWSLGATSPNPVMCPLGNTVVQEYNLLWSNHDIRTATTVDVDTLEYTLGTAIYFKSCIFRLPDGTELPALPEGVFEKYPYGVIYRVVAAALGTDVYCAYAFKDTTNFCYVENCDASDGGGIGTINGGVDSALYNYIVGTSTTWSDPTEKTDNSFIIPLGNVTADDGTGTVTLVWSNFDIITAEEDSDGNYVKTGNVYRKSDVNYRIYGGWLNSMGNQARRLGNVSGALKPGEMETVFKGVTAGGSGGGITLGSNASGYVPDIPKGYGHSVFELGSIETAAH